MTFAEPVGEVNLGANQAGWIARMLRDGQSANSILRTFQDAGAGMRREYGLNLIRQVRASISDHPELGALEPGALPTAEQYSTWAMGSGGQYATSVTVAFRDVETGLAGVQPFTYVTDEPHTPEEAAQAAIDTYSEGEETDDYNRRIMGALPGTMYATVPWVRQ